MVAISIHAPRAGRDKPEEKGGPEWQDFNPRAPCGARLILAVHQISNVHISIHAPRAGRDGYTQEQTTEIYKFQSTRPVRGAT